MPEGVEPRWTLVETGGSHPPPEDISQPGGGEDIVDIDAAARVPAGQFRRLTQGFAIGFLVAPMMKKGKCAEDVDEEKSAAERPGPAGEGALIGASPCLEKDARADGIGDESQPDGESRQEVAPSTARSRCPPNCTPRSSAYFSHPGSARSRSLGRVRRPCPPRTTRASRPAIRTRHCAPGGGRSAGPSDRPDRPCRRGNRRSQNAPPRQWPAPPQSGHSDSSLRPGETRRKLRNRRKTAATQSAGAGP